MDRIGQRLRELREGIKLSQAKLAALAGTTQATINRYESGVSSTPLKMLIWYADYFDVSMQRNRPDMLRSLLTTASRQYSAIRPPATRKGLWKASWATYAGMSVSPFQKQKI